MARYATLLLVVLAMTPSHASADSAVDARAKALVGEIEKKLAPLEATAALAWWKANLSGADKDFEAKQQAENRVNELLSDRPLFARLKALRQEKVGEPVLARSIDVLYLAFLEKQVDRKLLEKIVALSNGVEQSFNAFRATVDGKSYTQNDVRKVLEKSHSSATRRKVWLASKEVGGKIGSDLAALVKLRNQAARGLGLPNYHALQLMVNEQDGAQLLKLFDELDELTRDQFAAAKEEIDERLAADCGISAESLMPWHYHDPFFQEAPDLSSGLLDKAYRQADLSRVTRDFYAGIGLPVDDVLKRSDLYERPGKSPHAFCTDIDRAGDVRVLCNVVGDENWMSTMLHEFGHAVYSSKNIPQTVPYVLRREAHILTTEGVAMMFERVTGQSRWLKKMGLSVEDPKAFDAAGAKRRRNQLLIFSRWCQVMLRFEKAMYEDPDQDLGKLWWDLVEKYQMLERPPGRNAPDYASKIHIVSAPVYYHNYMLGQLFAAQVHQAMARQLGQPSAEVIYVGEPRVGKFMTERVFAPGRTMTWDGLTRHATGAELNARAFAGEFKSP